jgi:formate C-acetyltransferase
MFEADIREGRLTHDTALELLQAFIIKCAELMWMSSELGRNISPVISRLST